MQFVVYIIFSHDTKKFYAGQSDNFDLRLSSHNQGLTQSTKSGVPWIPIWIIPVNPDLKQSYLKEKSKKEV
jgi:predicted GIY-YIG superfamily endonuclease